MTDKNNDSVSLIDTFKSTLWAFLGVQSDANRERDFSKGKPLHFILVGLVVTIMFILCIWGLVQLLLKFSGVE